MNHIKEYMAEDISEAKDGSMTRAIQLKAQVDRPIITRQQEDSISADELITGI